MKYQVLNIAIIPMLAGLLMFFAYDPYGFSIISIFSLIMFIYTIENGQKLFLKSSIYYLSYSLIVLVSFNEILKSETTDVDIVYMISFFSMYVIMFSLFINLFFVVKSKFNLSLYWLAFFWVGFEEFKTFFLDGFPFIKIGGAWTDSLLIGLYPIIGETGVSLFIILTSIAIYQFISNKKAIHLIVPGVILLISFLSYNKIWVDFKEENNVTIVQTNLTDAEKWNKAVVERTIKSFISLLKTENYGSIVLFPETAIPVTEDVLINKIYQLRNSAHNKLVLIGMPKIKINIPKLRQEYSSVTAMGDSEDVFLKERLIPIAEYIPLYDWIKKVLKIKEQSGYVGYKGKKQANIKWNNLNVASFICYEITYSGITRKRIDDKTGFIAVLKNISAFNDTRVKDIHYQLIKLRSLENQRYSIVSGNTGYSGVIDIFGKEIVKTKSWKEDIIKDKIKIYNGNTPYNKYGDSFVVILLVLFIIKELYLYNKKEFNN